MVKVLRQEDPLQPLSLQPLSPPLAHDHVLNALAVSVLLLKRDEARVEAVGLVLGDVVQRVLVDGAGSVRLLDLLLKLGELEEELLLWKHTWGGR